MKSPWLTSSNLEGREVARAHYYEPSSTDPLCSNSGNFGYDPKPAKKNKKRCKHCLRLLKGKSV
jgi:hypothetical protein